MVLTAEVPVGYSHAGVLSRVVFQGKEQSSFVASELEEVLGSLVPGSKCITSAFNMAVIYFSQLQLKCSYLTIRSPVIIVFGPEARTTSFRRFASQLLTTLELRTVTFVWLLKVQFTYAMHLDTGIFDN